MLPFDKESDPVNEPAGSLTLPSAAGAKMGGGPSDPSVTDPDPKVSADETSNDNPLLLVRWAPIAPSGARIKGVVVTTEGGFVDPDPLDELDSEEASEAAVWIVETAVSAVETGNTEKGTGTATVVAVANGAELETTGTEEEFTGTDGVATGVAGAAVAGAGVNAS
ncbi:unnamed protein product [Peronospora destructor]|uniref:Uncharacterized protein n=1 Tax=Peronospora destructor TaxID=86335 RepID=A0AAV0TNX6_9STRA|nr:unnamed protein product [Peronospora destructor]